MTINFDLCKTTKKLFIAIWNFEPDSWSSLIGLDNFRWEIIFFYQITSLLYSYQNSNILSLKIHIWIIVFIGDYEYCPGGPKFMLPPSSTKWNIEPPTFIFWDNIQHLSAFNVSYFDIKHQVIVFFDQGQKLKYLFISMWFGCYWNVESIMVLDNVGTKH